MRNNRVPAQEIMGPNLFNPTHWVNQWMQTRDVNGSALGQVHIGPGTESMQLREGWFRLWNRFRLRNQETGSGPG